jgi:hypothetical protein
MVEIYLYSGDLRLLVERIYQLIHLQKFRLSKSSQILMVSNDYYEIHVVAKILL